MSCCSDKAVSIDVLVSPRPSQDFLSRGIFSTGELSDHEDVLCISGLVPCLQFWGQDQRREDGWTFSTGTRRPGHLGRTGGRKEHSGGRRRQRKWVPEGGPHPRSSGCDSGPSVNTGSPSLKCGSCGPEHLNQAGRGPAGFAYFAPHPWHGWPHRQVLLPPSLEAQGRVSQRPTPASITPLFWPLWAADGAGGARGGRLQGWSHGRKRRGRGQPASQS